LSPESAPDLPSAQLQSVGTEETVVNSPQFDKIIELTVARSLFQKKKLEQYLSRMDVCFFARAEEFAGSYIGYLDSQGIPLDYAIEAYLGMCNSMMKCQIEFMKTGTYRTTDHDQAFEEVYSSPERMKPYMIALAISQFLWLTHYRIYEAFEDTIRENAPRIGAYLEIGPGHGLYLHKAIQHLNPDTVVHAVDISPVSMDITKSIIGYFHPGLSNANFWTGDFLSYAAPVQYDFITMGEVLEHVNEPHLLLSRLEQLLSDSGMAFVTTSINSPAVDHVYHFKSVDDVRVMIRSAGLAISNEQVLPVEDLPMAEIVAKKITINYSAVLRRATAK
jgi:2-polyprenyl-3-methyl-5-hydroxy-6-metoxy-1,4-benzoquinol methylase